MKKILFNSRFRLYFGIGILIICFIGWPLSAFTLAKGEPLFILSLSWFALILSALEIMNTALANLEEKEKK